MTKTSENNTTEVDTLWTSIPEAIEGAEVASEVGVE